MNYFDRKVKTDDKCFITAYQQYYCILAILLSNGYFKIRSLEVTIGF